LIKVKVNKTKKIPHKFLEKAEVANRNIGELKLNPLTLYYEIKGLQPGKTTLYLKRTQGLPDTQVCLEVEPSKSPKPPKSPVPNCQTPPKKHQETCVPTSSKVFIPLH
jgi:hypothetical protein